MAFLLSFCYSDMQYFIQYFIKFSMYVNNSKEYSKFSKMKMLLNIFNCYRHYQSNFPNYIVKEIMNDDKYKKKEIIICM